MEKRGNRLPGLPLGHRAPKHSHAYLILIAMFHFQSPTSGPGIPEKFDNITFWNYYSFLIGKIPQNKT